MQKDAFLNRTTTHCVSPTLPPLIGGGPEQLVLVLVLQQGAEGRMPKGGLLAACQREVRERLNPLFKASVWGKWGRKCGWVSEAVTGSFGWGAAGGV